MRPVRFVALSEDGQALVLTDEVGRLLTLPFDDRLGAALRRDGSTTRGQMSITMDMEPSLSPRDIQARIRAGESAEDVARIANVPVDRVLRYAGPVLQERAMLAQHARRTRLRSSDRGASLGEMIDARLAQHGVDAQKISWDAYRKEDGTWRVAATWPSGKATAQATWELDKARQVVTPHDDMAQFLSTERPTPLLGQEPAADISRPALDPLRGGHDQVRSGHDPIRPTRDMPGRGSPGRGSPGRGSPGGGPLRGDALRAALERPLGETGRGRPAAVGAFGAADEHEGNKDMPAVPSLAVLRPRRVEPAVETVEAADGREPKPRSRLPSWDDVLFGGGPQQRGH